MPSPSPLLSLGLGFALGGAAAWFALRPPASASAASDASPAPVALPAWSWRESGTPPLLARDTAAAAISAWLAQRSPDGRPLPFATRTAGLRALLLRIPPEAYPRLADALARSPVEEDRLLLGIAFGAWSTQDAPAAARWAGLGGEKTHSLAREALGRWLALDTAAAAEWVCGLRDDRLARALVGLALARLAEKHPERALALAKSRDGEFQDTALRAVLEALGKKDPAGTLQRFGPDLWKHGSGFYQVRSLLAGWARQDSAAAISWLLAQPRGEQADLSHWLGQLSDRSPAGRKLIAEALAAHPDLPGRAFALQGLLADWSNESPDDALAWIRALPDPDLRLNLLERANNQGYYTDNPQKSLPLALALPEGANREKRLSELLGAWAKRDPEATLAWLREHSAEPGVSTASHAVHASLLADLAREEPAAALAEYATLSDAAARRSAINAIAQAWGKNDPAAALRWAAEQSALVGQNSLGHQAELIFAWAKQEPETALRWLEAWIQERPEAHRQFNERYLDSLGGTWREKAPRAATAELLAKITDPQVRERALSRHVREWLAKDPAGARAWVESAKVLTPDQAATLLSIKP